MPPSVLIGRHWSGVAQDAQQYRDKTLSLVYPELSADSGQALPINVRDLPSSKLSNDELHVTETTPEDLVIALNKGALTSADVTRAFLRRAAVAQTLVKLDEYLAHNGKPVGPLHGLPISVKEHINMKGLGINGGYCSEYETIAEHDVHMLKILYDAGAVFYARTTQPQTVMHLETSSNLYGTTVNPFNRNLTAGGSSGGEGALLALRGSCLGIGSDIGGSIRSPAANNGLFGLRPTAYRVPCANIMMPPVGDEGIIGVYGPLSTTLEGINLFMRTVLAPSPWLTEPSLVPLPWREDVDFLPKKLKVGVMWDDGVVKPHPPIQRALRGTVANLREAGDVEIVDWHPHQHDYAWRLIQSLYFPDGGESDKAAIARSGEPWLPLSRFILSENPYVKHLSVPELWDLVNERETYRTEYAKLWNETATGTDELGRPTGMVDVILCPAGPSAAPLLETARYWGYTSQWNLLDYPALVVPTVLRVDANSDMKDAGYVPRNADDQYNWESYEPSSYAHAPLSLQIVGRRFEDEKVLQAARRLGKYCRWEAA
ncbi:MAG: hypothetical protein Q9159_005972 [Coniocarpon cinnabarinum]